MKTLPITLAVLALVVLNLCIMMDDVIGGCSLQKMERDRYQEAHSWRKKAKGILTPVRLGWLVPYDEPGTEMCYLNGYELPTDPWIVSKVAVMALFAGALYRLMLFYRNKNMKTMLPLRKENQVLSIEDGKGSGDRKDRAEDSSEDFLGRVPEETGLPPDLSMDIHVIIQIRNGRVVGTPSEVVYL